MGLPDLTQRGLADRFENLELSADGFSHRAHVAVAFAMLRKHPFLEATSRFGTTLHAMATAAGAVDKYNTTITVAFMALIFERMGDDTTDDFEAFCAANPDLLAAGTLRDLYSPERLNSPAARAGFVLPDRPGLGDERTVGVQVAGEGGKQVGGSVEVGEGDGFHGAVHVAIR